MPIVVRHVKRPLRTYLPTAPSRVPLIVIGAIVAVMAGDLCIQGPAALGLTGGLFLAVLAAFFVGQVRALLQPITPLLSVSHEGLTFRLSHKPDLTFVPWSEVVDFRLMTDNVAGTLAPAYGFAFTEAVREKIKTIDINFIGRDRKCDDPDLTLCLYQMTTFGAPASWAEEVGEIYARQRTSPQAQRV